MFLTNLFRSFLGYKFYCRLFGSLQTTDYETPLFTKRQVLKSTAKPSIFQWTQCQPKRKPPANRSFDQPSHAVASATDTTTGMRAQIYSRLTTSAKSDV
jgi:hypothetical protein